MAEEEKPPDRDLLKLDYEQCVEHGTFMVGTRFTYFASFTTVFFVLIGAYYYFWTAEERVFKQLQPAVLLAAALFGLYTVGLAQIIELRNMQVFRICYNHAATLEKVMGIQNGIWHILMHPEVSRRFLRIPITHTTAIMMFYGAVAFIWFSLVIFSSYLLWRSLPT